VRIQVHKQVGNRPQTAPNARSIPSGSTAPTDYQQPPLTDLFDGSKPKFGRVYDKYIAGTQVPHPVRTEEYYDLKADTHAVKSYYNKIESLAGEARTSALRELVTQTHTPEPKGYDFAIAKSLYTVVDRRPDGTVRDVYTKEPIGMFSYPNIPLSTLDENELKSIAGAMTSAPEVIASWLAFKEGRANLNCEHVVPQSFFDKREPMRSDLHHLYACDIKANSARGNTPYGSFKPEGGRGEVARATLYFMLRYPEVKTPYDTQDVALLKSWSEADPPSLHEKRRNCEIQKLQGNRNPFIDNPDWLKDFNP
jgi:endonuclease G, mitochondrial